MAEIINTFTGGMVTDSLDSMLPPNSYLYAFNAVNKSDDKSNFGLTNEYEFEEAADFGVPIVGKSYIEERNQTLYFTKDDGLWLLDHKTDEKIFVCRASEFGCEWNFSNCELLYGEFKKFNKCKELHVYFSSNCIYHVVNIDEMLNSKRKEAIKSLDDVCGHFDLMKCVCGPHISAIPSRFNGSAVEAGAYACAVQLSDEDGNETNVFDIGQFAFAESEDNVGGQIGKSSIKFTISSLDKRYSRAIIYIIKTIRGVTTVEKMGSYAYSDRGLTYEYYGQKGELVNVSTLTTRSKAFLRGQDLIQKDGFLILYSLRNERNLNYQKHANNISVSYVEYEVSLEQAAKYHYPSLLRGEVYAIGIVWKYCDGTFSPVFHIPGGGGGAASLEVEAQLSVGTGTADLYNPIQISDFDTTDQFKRERNPSTLKERPLESDKLEDSTETDIQNIDTNKQNIIEAGACHDNLYGCGTAQTILNQDIDDVSNTIESSAELLAGYGLDKPDPDVNTTSSWKDAALMILDAVRNREFIKRKRPVLKYDGSGSNQGAPGGTPETVSPSTPEVTQSEVTTMSASTRGDNWVDGVGNNLTDEPPREVSTGAMQTYTSTVQYPNDKDCDGQRFFPQGNVKHHRVPWSSDKPHFVSAANGVENQYQPDNNPYGKTYIRVMGLKLSGIHKPSDEELPKPLCPNSPFKVVYVKRTDQNKSIFAKGWLTGIFEGENYGVNYAFPRHGVNSFEHVDRGIAPKDDPMSRKGKKSTEPIYNFHSPDTDGRASLLPVNKIKSELALRGSGWLYGQYVEGKKPEDTWNGKRKDITGARVANNLNHYTKGGATLNISGITEAPANTSPSPTSGISLPLMNTYRESSVYLQASGRLQGDEHDESFIGVTLDHFFPTKCNAPYAALIRELPDQYGSVQGLQYSDLGLNATQTHAEGATEIKGICGDTFIGPYSKKRTSYVSNKRGDLFGVPAKPGSPCRERSWADSPDDKIFAYLGMTNPTKFPQSGDKYDPKNYAGLHTTGSGCGGMVSKTASQAAAVGSSESDWYGPRTLTSLVHSIVECEVNPYLRETGEGDQRVTRKVHYGNLKGLALDAAAPVGHFWEDSWMTGFHDVIEQPSAKQISTKTYIRNAINVLGPVGAWAIFSNLDGIIGPAFSIAGWSMTSALWILANNVLFTDNKLNDLLKIGDFKRDEEGGDLDERIEGFEDNYTRYNQDFQRVNDIYPYTAMPLPYNSCPCNNCSKENINNEIYYTNKQNLDSDIDAYKNIKINNYTNIPAHYGDLKKLFIQNNQLWAHLTDGISLLKLNPIQMQSDIVLQQSGDGQLLSEPQLIFEGLLEGFGGTEHPNASINTPAGYWFIDNRAKKLYKFNGQFEEISAYGMFHFFKKYLGFCDEKECYDEKSENGNHYSLGWDNRNNRLLLTKYDGSDCGSFTVSFDPQGSEGKPQWVSFHKYIPQDYNWDRDNFYIITGSKVLKQKTNSFITPFYVETSVVGGQPFYTESFYIDSFAEKGFNKDIDTTFNKIALYNSTQGTGTREVDFISDNRGEINDQFSRVQNDPSKIRLFKKHRRWVSNEVHDLVKADCKNEAMITKECDCAPIPQINEGVFDCSVLSNQDFKGRKLIDDRLNFRLIWDEDNSTRLYLKKLVTKVEAEKIL